MNARAVLVCLALAVAATGCKCSNDDPPPPNQSSGVTIAVKDPESFLKGEWKAIGVEGVPADKKAGFDALARTSSMTIDGSELVVTSTVMPGQPSRRQYRITANDDGHIKLATVMSGKPGAAVVEAVDKDTIRVRHDKELGFTLYKRK